ncbi:3516_t:CDS:2 [Scutellospora calospora]|uniref:3516_t:CDS:1 n=1 Tax=Scutellospora calospora TaxID=85575 RepID=A0ACA9LQC3_9GLOM|nr:3516_t:CDS:2 [Scutellospora calospora]
MSTTKLSKLLPDHEKYHHNPIIHKTKSYTFWYSIQNKDVFLNQVLNIQGHLNIMLFQITLTLLQHEERKSENSRISGPLLFGLHLKQIQKNQLQSNYIRPLKQFNELSISTKKACARTVTKKIKKDFNQIAKKNYYPNDQVTLKELSYTVANTPFYVKFGSQNIIEKNKYELAIVQIIDKYQISRDRYRALSAIQPNLPRDYAVFDQRTILTSKMANYILIETFNLYSQDNLLLNEEFQLVKKVARQSIKDILLYLHPYLVANKILHSSKPVINLRISGDGYNVRKKINHVIITLAILDQKKELYLSDNHYTIVIYSDIEKYELLKSATQPLVDELNELQQSGFVDKNGIN